MLVEKVCIEIYPAKHELLQIMFCMMLLNLLKINSKKMSCLQYMSYKVSYE